MFENVEKDKINFAIEQLKNAIKYFRSQGDCNTYTTYEVIRQLNIQINELKEMNNE